MEEVKFPSVNNYGKIPEILQKIVEAQEPIKLTHEKLRLILGRKTTSDRPFIPFLKRLKFLDEENIPTHYYKDYRDGTKSKAVLADCIKDVYAPVYLIHEKLHELDKPSLLEKFKIVTKLSSDNQTLKNIVSSFEELIQLADFESALKDGPIEKPKDDSEEGNEENSEGLETMKKLGFSYTINLNLPATTDQRVYNAIFKSLKENLIK